MAKTNETKKAELAVPGVGGQVAEAPSDEMLAFFAEAKGEGLEKVGADDVVIPRLTIIQSMSPQVKARTAGPGDLFNVVTGANFGEKGVKFVPLFFWGSRTEWTSNDPGADIVCTARDGENGSVKDAEHAFGKCAQCPKRQFTMDDKGKAVMPKCTDYKNVLLVPLPDGEDYRDQHPVAFSAKRTGIQAFKNFLTACNSFKMGGVKLPLYSHIWLLRPQELKNEKGDFYGPGFEDMGLIQDMNMLRYFQGLCREMKAIQDKFYIPEENNEGGSSVAASSGGDSIDAEFVANSGI